jgi:hypothetical protein
MFNQFGSFSVSTALDAGALAAAADLLARLPLCPLGSIERIYDHWTVGHLDQDFPDYNVSVRFDGAHFHLDITHDLRDNARGVNALAPASHTYMRNTGAVGISVDAMVGANVHDFGPEATTKLMIEYLCAANAAAAEKYAIDLSGTSTRAPYAGEPTLLTHAEAADRIGSPPQYLAYGPGSTCERWDLSSLIALPAGVRLTADMARSTGDAIRERSHAYKVALCTPR